VDRIRLANTAHVLTRTVLLQTQTMSTFTGPRINNTSNISYRIDPLPRGWDARTIIGGINTALAIWQSVTPFIFNLVPGPADIQFQFGPVPNLPNGGTQGAITKRPIITVNSNLTFSAVLPSPPNTADIIDTILHEVGHYFGLGHSSNPESVMYFQNGLVPKRALSADDIEAIQAVYGSPTFAIPGWFGTSTDDVDVAAGDLSGTGKVDLIVAHIDAPSGFNQIYYRVGWNLDSRGSPTLGWSAPMPVGGPIARETRGLGITMGDLNNNGRPELVAVWMDNPRGGNQVYYRIGWDLDTAGFTSNFSSDIPAGQAGTWWGNETAGIAAALADLDDDGRLELIIAWVDAPPGPNKAYYRIGWGLDAQGIAAIWSREIPIPGWWGDETQSIGLALKDLRGNGRPDMVVVWTDSPTPLTPQGYYRIGFDLDRKGNAVGDWTSQIRMDGRWGTNSGFGTQSLGCGADLAMVREMTRPDLITVHVDRSGGNDRVHSRLTCPALPTWSAIVPVTNSPPNKIPLGSVARLAATSPSSNVTTVGFRRTGGPYGISIATWDQTALNTSNGAEVLEFDIGLSAPARADSPVSLVSRLRNQVDIFWIDGQGAISTSFAGNMGAGNGVTPVWANPFSLSNPGAVIAASSLTAVTLNWQHEEVFFVDLEGAIYGKRWFNGIWSPVKRIAFPAEWSGPPRDLVAVARASSIHLFWTTDDLAIMSSVGDDQDNWSAPTPIAPAYTARVIAAVSRNSDHIDLFWINTQAKVQSTWWSTITGVWAPPFEVGSGHRAEGVSKIAAVHSNGQRVHVFWEDQDHSIWTNWWQKDGWAFASAVTPPRTVNPGTDIAVVSRLNGSVPQLLPALKSHSGGVVELHRLRVLFVDKTQSLSNIWFGLTP
jgi:matrixin